MIIKSKKSQRARGSKGVSLGGGSSGVVGGLVGRGFFGDGRILT